MQCWDFIFIGGHIQFRHLDAGEGGTCTCLKEAPLKIGVIPEQYENTYDYVKQVYGDPGLEWGYKDFIPMFKAEKWDPG